MYLSPSLPGLYWDRFYTGKQSKTKKCGLYFSLMFFQLALPLGGLKQFARKQVVPCKGLGRQASSLADKIREDLSNPYFEYSVKMALVSKFIGPALMRL